MRVRTFRVAVVGAALAAALGYGRLAQAQRFLAPGGLRQLAATVVIGAADRQQQASPGRCRALPGWQQQRRVGVAGHPGGLRPCRQGQTQTEQPAQTAADPHAA